MQSDDTLHEEIYVWEPHEDVWGSIADSTTRIELRDLLLQRFDPFRPPGERSFLELLAAIDKIRTVIDAGKTQWADCEQSVGSVHEQDIQFRANTLQALHDHLAWLHAIFHSVPGASVTIR